MHVRPWGWSWNGSVDNNIVFTMDGDPNRGVFLDSFLGEGAVRDSRLLVGLPIVTDT